MKSKKPNFAAEGYQTNIKGLNRTPLPDLSNGRKSPVLDARTKAINAAMRRAAKAAAKRARAAGTKLYVMRKGKIVAESP